jgi:outer membrane biosynthesis protein TonB
MNRFSMSCLCVMGGLLMTGAANADAWNKKTIVTISQSIEVPGAVLAPGKYVFKLMNSDSNRHVVQIMNERENHVYTTNLAFAKQRMEPADKTVLTFYEMPGGGPEPIRSWFYPGDTIGQEFAYPKTRATEIAQATHQKVPVLSASNETAATVAAPVETPTPAVETAAEPAPTTVPAESEQPVAAPPPSPEAAAAEPQPDAAPAPPPEEEQAATPPATPSDTAPAEPKMPQTASNIVAIGLIGLGCFGIAASMRMAARSRS